MLIEIIAQRGERGERRYVMHANHADHAKSHIAKAVSVFCDGMFSELHDIDRTRQA
jgi:hypothetical protein